LRARPDASSPPARPAQDVGSILIAIRPASRRHRLGSLGQALFLESGQQRRSEPTSISIVLRHQDSHHLNGVSAIGGRRPQTGLSAAGTTSQILGRFRIHPNAGYNGVANNDGFVFGPDFPKLTQRVRKDKGDRGRIFLPSIPPDPAVNLLEALPKHHESQQRLQRQQQHCQVKARNRHHQQPVYRLTIGRNGASTDAVYDQARTIATARPGPHRTMNIAVGFQGAHDRFS